MWCKSSTRKEATLLSPKPGVISDSGIQQAGRVYLASGIFLEREKRVNFLSLITAAESHTLWLISYVLCNMLTQSKQSSDTNRTDVEYQFPGDGRTNLIFSCHSASTWEEKNAECTPNRERERWGRESDRWKWKRNWCDCRVIQWCGCRPDDSCLSGLRLVSSHRVARTAPAGRGECVCVCACVRVRVCVCVVWCEGRACHTGSEADIGNLPLQQCVCLTVSVCVCVCVCVCVWCV